MDRMIKEHPAEKLPTEETLAVVSLAVAKIFSENWGNNSCVVLVSLF